MATIPTAAIAKGVGSSPRILIVRLSAIGDTIHTLPLAAALREAFPTCHLGWVVEKPAAGLIEGNPLVDWVRVLPKGWLKSPSLIRELYRDLLAQRFRIAFDVQGLTKSAVAARLSGARVRIGFSRGEAREAAPFLDNRLVEPRGLHAVEKTLSLLSGIGVVPPQRGDFAFPPCADADRMAIDAMGGEPAGSGFILCGPWGSFPAKLWPLERFGQLAEGLHAATGLQTLVLGHGTAEREAVKALSDRHPRSVRPAPDVSVAGVVELARRASLFVGCDSFPMHAAAAVGCRTLGLFGVTDPVRLGPYGPRGKYLYHALTLERSTRKRRLMGCENMLGLGVETVEGECLRLLGGYAGPTRRAGDETS